MSPPGTTPLGLFGLIILSGLWACARQELPPGTHPDDAPPRPVEVRPEYGSSRPDFDGAASVRFDEPLNNPRTLERAIVASPAGDYEVDVSRSGLEIRPEDGWKDSTVYFLTLPPGVSDLLRNVTTEPVEWLFSTGGEVPPTEVSGRVIDRVTARGAVGMRLLFLSPDSVPYTAVSDTGGVFRLPGLPYGDYEALGFGDQNRNFIYDDEVEPGGVAPFSLSETEPEVELEVVVLPADSTAPIVTEAEAIDGLTLRLSFDDPLDPEANLDSVRITVSDSASGRTVEVAEFVIGELPMVADTMEVEAEAAADTAAVAPGDTVDVVPADTVVPPAADTLRPLPADSAAIPGFEPAPSVVSIELAEPLEEGVTYLIEVAGFPNLRALRGGGTVRLQYTPPEPLVPPRDAEGVDAEEPPAEES